MYVNLKESIENNLYFMGLFRVGYHKNKLFDKILYNLWIIFLGIFSITGICHLVTSDLEEFITNGYIFITLLAAYARFFLVDRKKVKASIDFFSEKTFQPQNEQQAKILQKHIIISKRIFGLFFFAVNSSVFWFGFGPFLSENRQLINQARYPFEFMDNKYLFNIIYFHQAYCVFLCGMTNICIETMVAILLIQIRAQCEILCEKLAVLGKDESSEIAYKKFVKCVDHHKLILAWTNQVGQTFHNEMLVQFVSSVLVFCQSMYLLSKLDFGPTVIVLIVYLFALFVQLFMYGWFGNELAFQSRLIPYAAFSCFWYRCSLKFQKDLMYFIRRTQYPIIIYVGNIFPNDINTFLAILKSSWSYFMMLRRVNENRD